MPSFDDKVEKLTVGVYHRQAEQLARISRTTGHPQSAILRRAIDIALKHFDQCSPPLACAMSTGCAEHDAPSPLGLQSMNPIGEVIAPAEDPEPAKDGQDAKQIVAVIHQTFGGREMSLEEKYGDTYKINYDATFDILSEGRLRGIGGIISPGFNWTFHVEGLEPKYGSEHSARRWLSAFGYNLQWTWKRPELPGPSDYNG